MNAPLPLVEILRLREPSAQQTLPLATDGVLRYVWEHRYGSMLIEVVGDDVLIDGQRVEPAAPALPAQNGHG